MKNIKLFLIAALLCFSSNLFYGTSILDCIDHSCTAAIGSMVETISNHLNPGDPYRIDMSFQDCFLLRHIEKALVEIRDEGDYGWHVRSALCLIKNVDPSLSFIERLSPEKQELVCSFVLAVELRYGKDIKFDFNNTKESVKDILLLHGIKFKCYSLIKKLDPTLSHVEKLLSPEQEESFYRCIIGHVDCRSNEFAFNEINPLIQDKLLLLDVLFEYRGLIKRFDPTLSILDRLSIEQQKIVLSRMVKDWCCYKDLIKNVKESIKDMIILRAIVLQDSDAKKIISELYHSSIDFIARLSLEKLSLEEEELVISWIIKEWSHFNFEQILSRHRNKEYVANNIFENKFNFNTMKKSTRYIFLKQCLLEKEFSILRHLDPKFSSFIEPFIQKIKNGSDLTDQEKQLLTDAYGNIDLYDLIKNDSITSIDNVVKSDVTCLSREKLEKYLPVVAYRQRLCNLSPDQEEAEFKEKCSEKYPHVHFESTISVDKKKTLTESLGDKLLRQSVLKRSELERNFFIPTTIAKTGSGFYEAGYVANLKATGIIPLVKEQEAKLEIADYEPFYHGRDWEWNFVNEVWNIIQAIKQNKEDLSDRISMRFRTGLEDIDQLQNHRKKLVESGTDYHFGTGVGKAGKESETTCMNKALVSNSGYYGECSATYFLDNTSVAGKGTGKSLIPGLFEQEGLADLYDRYKDEIEDLFKQHQQSSSVGEVLCIAIDKKHIDEMVYPAKSGGRKNGTEKASKIIETNKKRIIDDPEYLDTEHLFYCLAVTDIPGEYGTREEGGKYFIKSLNLADPEKYAAYQKSRDALFEKMKRGIMEENLASWFVKKSALSNSQNFRLIR